MLSPSFAIVLVFVYGFILFTFYLSFTDSRILPSFGWVGWQNYERLFGLRAWGIAVNNLLIFGSLYIVICCALGLLLAILLDQKIRAEGFIRTIYLYPMALSLHRDRHRVEVVPRPRHRAAGGGAVAGAGRASPSSGSRTATWRSTPSSSPRSGRPRGFVMAMFLAGLRGIDNEVMKAAQIDGASTFALYRRIVIPQLRPAFMSAFVVLAHMAIKSYDLVIALTGGGPGTATELPATFMYSYTFTRNQMGIGAASAVIMLMSIAAIMVPFIWSELREKK